MAKRCYSQLFLLLACLITTRVSAQTFGVYRELWTGLTGTDLQYLTNVTYNPNWPSNPNSSTNFTTFETEVDSGRVNYGQRLRAFILPPTNGDYTFWIASDDSSQLFLSSDETPDNKSQIACVNAWTASREWGKEGNQKSAPITLQAGRRYYIETIMIQGSGGDDCAVRWQLPDQSFEEPIPATNSSGPRLIPCRDQVALPGFYQAPTNVAVIETSDATFSVLVTNQSPVTYQWRVNGIDLTDPAALTPIYTVSNVPYSSSGQEYTCIVSDSAGSVTSAPALLLVSRDTTPPTVSRVMNLGTNTVQLIFSKNMDAASATNLTNYVLSGGLTISQAALLADLRTVVLTTTPMVYGSNYTIVVNGVQDCSVVPNTIATDTTLIFQALVYASQDIGNPSTPSTTTILNNGLDITAVGNDIGGYADQFSFSYQMRTGDFDISTRVPAFASGDVWAKAGLMARDTLAANSRFAATLATPSMSGVFLEYRFGTGSITTSLGSFPANYPNTWLRLKRAGNLFTSYASYDGQTWTQIASASVSLSTNAYVGVAVCSHDLSQAAQVQFRDLTFRNDTPVLGTPVNPHEPLGPSSRKTPIAISEIMYKPAPRADGNNLEFIEIYNSNPFFHDISGYRLVGDNLSYTFPQGTIIQGGAFIAIAASPQSIQNFYGITNVFGPYTGSLKKSGTLQLLDELGSVLLTIPYSNLNPWPIGADGTGHSLVLAKPTYGEADPRAWDISNRVGGTPGMIEPFQPTPLRDVVINELLITSTDSAVPSFVELYNHSAQTNDISGCILTDDATTNTFVIPAGTVLTPTGFVSFATSQLGFSLNPVGGTIFLLSPDSMQILSAVQYDPQADGVSLGRSPEGAPSFNPLTTPTPAAANSAILVGDIVINELMYNPISRNDDDQYIELYNKGSNSISLANWQFTSGIIFTFPSNTVIAPNGYLVVARNQTNLFAKYPNLSIANTVGNFTGKLGHGGERVALAMPQIAIDSKGKTNTVYVVEDEVTYGSGGRWGQWASGGGSSLELVDPRSNHRLAANWKDSDETQKSVWTNIETTGVLDNGSSYSGSVDFAQLGMLETGECLVDNVEVRPSTTGANNVANSTFDNGLSSWSLQGTHFRSSLETNGYGGSAQCLHIRATDRMWTGVNSCEVGISSSGLYSGQTATLRFKARWLHGSPEVLLRLAGNWLEAVGTMPVPSNLGTPGAPNSCYATNVGPAIYDVSHSPAIPAANQPVVVTARVHDPDAPVSVVLSYRVDPSTAYTVLAMRDDGKGGDAVAGDGVYSATIPGYAQNTVVAFYITARDRSVTSTRFPALLNNNAPDRECVIMYGDGNPGGAFGVYHLWITQVNATRWANLSNLSNESHDCTIVNGNRVIYNAQGRFTGSPYHQQYDTPYGRLCSYKWTFPDDDKFLGATSFNKIHQPGNGFANSGTQESDQSFQREQTANSLLRSLGVPWLYRRFVIVYVNGDRRGQIMEDAQTPDSDAVEQWHPNDKNGFLYKMQPWFEFARQPYQNAFPSSISFNNNSWCTLNTYLAADGSFKTARYRYNFLMRSSPDSNSNYTNVFNLVKAAGSYGTANYVANMQNIADMENWMRVFAANHAAGNWDSFGSQNGQNLYGYIGTQGTKYTLHMFDFNIALGNLGDGASWGPGQNLLLVNSADPVTANIYREPTFRRMFWRAMQELCDGQLDVANSGPLIDAKFRALLASGITPESTSTLKSWLTSARDSIRTQIPGYGGNVAITAYLKANNTCTISGTAPVNIKEFTVNGATVPVTWTSDTGWKITVPLQPGTNVLNIAGIDIHGKPISGMTNSFTTVYTGTLASPQGSVVINEIMYNPAVPAGQYVELYNNSTTQTFDLSNWQLRGLSYVFPVGTYLGPKSFLVLAANRDVFASTYGSTIPVFDTFDTLLPQDTSVLSLVQPGTNGTNDLIISRVKYENARPWPTPNPGTSLELIDSRQDNWRVGNWGTPKPSAPQWAYVTATGTGSNSKLYIYLESAGDVYIDDMKLVAGSVPESGANLLSNGDFESSFPGAWTVSTNLSNSSISTTVKHSGTRSLHVVSTSAGSTQGSSIWQTASPALQTGSQYTLSFWYLPSTNGGPLTVRLSGNGIVSTINPAQGVVSTNSFATPGAVNYSSNTIAAFPPLWINELQADNLTGITNSAGQRTPWIEIYNPTTNTVSLNGVYLANNYTNLAAWAFPSTATIQPGEFKLIFADGKTNLSTLAELHTSFTLSSGSGQLALSRRTSATQVLDHVTYTNVTADHSYGSFPDAQSFDRQEFYYPTPGATNNGWSAPPTVSINEWLANPISGASDWFELYNYGTNTVDLAGFYLTRQLTNKFMCQIPAGYAIPAKGFLLVWADKKTSTGGDLHVNFNLSKSGTSIGLFRADGTLVDSVTFGPQISNISQGRYPDASPNITTLPQTTPRASNNYIPNTAPVLSPIPDATLILGQTLAFTATASDSDLPAQTLTFSLDQLVPAGAQIDAVTGQFSWTPSTPGSNTIGIVLTDSGSPFLTATQRFTVTVVPQPELSVRTNPSQITFNWQTIAGQSYQIEYKDDLAPAIPWTPLGQALIGDGTAANVDIQVDTAPQRFYRLRVTR